MPTGLRRFQQSGQSHFLTFSCYRRQANLISPDACDLFVQCLEDMRRQFAMCIYGYVVMPAHVHLLVNEPKDAPLADAHSLSEVGVRQTNAQSKARYRIEFVLAETLLRPEREGRTGVHGKVTIPASQSGETRTGPRASRVEVEQLSSLRTAGNWDRRNRIRMDGGRSGNKNKGWAIGNVPEPRLASKERTRTWGTRP
jgi:REP element-mobilizing transposase RayT